MEVIINIGLNTNTGATIEVNRALQAIADNGAFVLSSEVFVSDTEPTLVATVRYSSWESVPAVRAYSLSVALEQDYVAMWFLETARGALVGPRASSWGAFNPEFFIMPTGERLAAPAARAA